jgi:hypothetical protein
MDFETWKAAASVALREMHGTDPMLIPEKVWHRLYVTNHSPREAAERAAMIYENTLRAGERTRHREA